MGEGLVFGPGALMVVGLYLVSMIGVGWIARKKRQSDSMADFYLAGRSLGLAVLFLTLYATQYSGNTLFGYTGKTYRIGFEWTASVVFMFSVIVGYMLFAPRLVLLARKEGFITPGDYIRYRFASPALTLLSTVLMIYALCNYTLAQLKAMGGSRRHYRRRSAGGLWHYCLGRDHGHLRNPRRHAFGGLDRCYPRCGIAAGLRNPGFSYTDPVGRGAGKCRRQTRRDGPAEGAGAEL